jgi:hypothetical protein
LVGSCCSPYSQGRPAPRVCVGKGRPSRDARLGRRPPSHTGGRDGRPPGRLDTARTPAGPPSRRTPYRTVTAAADRMAGRVGVRSCRPAGQARCPSWTAVRAGVRVVSGRRFGGAHPDRLSCFEGCRENSMSGRWRSARRRLAPTTRPWPRSAATSAACLGPTGGGARRGPESGLLGILLNSGQCKCFISRWLGEWK